MKKLDLLCAERVNRPYGLLYRMTDSNSDIGNISSSIISIEPGQKTSKHKHYQEEIWYIISGSGMVSGESRKFDISPGDVILIPSNEIHQLENRRGDIPLIYFVVMSPPRISASIIYYP